MRSDRLALISLLLLALAGPALAVDGVLEINFTCAVRRGCFSGDSAGFPVTIGVPGSYRLTSNLSIGLLPGGSQDEHFIEISADDVTLDLGGFRISCRDFFGGASCAGIDERSGVFASSSASGTTVKNGSIRGMRSRGVELGDGAEVTNLRVSSNGDDGIRVGKASKVSGNITYLNGSHGISTDTGSTVSGNTAFQNTGEGIFARQGSTISGNTARQNGGNGILAFAGAMISGNSTASNSFSGIVAGDNSTISGNTASGNGGAGGIDVGNGSTISGNTSNNSIGHGITTSTDCLVQRNNVRSNGAFGLFLAGRTAYRENVINANSGGSVSGGINMGANSCNGTPTCP